MAPINRWFICAAVVFVTSIPPSIAQIPAPIRAAVPGSAASKPADYVPSSVNLSRMDAEQIVLREVHYDKSRGTWPSNFSGGSFCYNGTCDYLPAEGGALKVLPHRFSIARSGGMPISVPLSTVHIAVTYASVWNAISAAIKLNDNAAFTFGFGESNATVRQIADALYVLASDGSKQSEAADIAAFEKVASDYRQSQLKPAFPEEARRLKVQAELAL